MVTLDVVDDDDDVSTDGRILFLCVWIFVYLSVCSFGSHIHPHSAIQWSSENQNQLCKLLSGKQFYGSNV